MRGLRLRFTVRRLMLLVLLASLILAGLEWRRRPPRVLWAGPYRTQELEPEVGLRSSGGRMTVAGRAAVYCGQPGGSDCLWSLRVYEDTPGRAPVLAYRCPARLADKSSLQYLTFNHSVVLPAGRYLVRLHLYVGRPGTPVSLLIGSEDSRDRASPLDGVVVQGEAAPE